MELKCYTVNKKPPHEEYRAEVFIVSLMSERLLLDFFKNKRCWISIIYKCVVQIWRLRLTCKPSWMLSP